MRTAEKHHAYDGYHLALKCLVKYDTLSCRKQPSV